MRRWWSGKKQSAALKEESTVIPFHDWKKGRKRWRIYRSCLLAALCLSVLALTGGILYYLDSNIPSVLHLRAGIEQPLQFKVPAKGEIVSVSEQGASNIPREAVDIDLSRQVTLKIGNADAYRMQVKLFGFLPFKQVEIDTIEDRELIPVGVPIGIYMKTNGILVVGTGEFEGSDGVSHSPAKYILKSGDYIQSLNGQAVDSKRELIDRIEQSEGREQILTIERNGESFDVQVKPKKDQNGKYKLGIWVRDNAQGVGTMTYIDSEGNFGALGHGINDTDTGTLMEMEDGTLYQTEIVSIRKGSIGKPGEMTGRIIYSDDRILGDITLNSTGGIFGKCKEGALQLASEEPLPIGLKQEIKEGEAKILCTVNGCTQYYDVRIEDIHLDNDNVNKGIELTITDSELLELTGGIVQGMSGSPIIQDGKIIGAVTHVLVQDATKGYGMNVL